MCSLDKLVGLADDSALNNGVPQLASFPPDAHFTMDPERPDDTVLTDNLFNTDRLIVVSKRLKDALVEHATRAVEFIPVGIKDHKGKLVPWEAFIVHPIDPVDCLDLDRSGARMSKIIKTRVSGIERLVLDEAKIEADRAMARIRNYNGATLIRRDIADALATQGFSGLRFIEPERFPED